MGVGYGTVSKINATQLTNYKTWHRMSHWIIILIWFKGIQFTLRIEEAAENGSKDFFDHVQE